ncbi:MAG: hypothetical protein SFU91_07940 [Chloroherpetonaceae bacterium]|nr:hypothetical protein [Chloroherpetonaceae bacterium]
MLTPHEVEFSEMIDTAKTKKKNSPKKATSKTKVSSPAKVTKEPKAQTKGSSVESKPIAPQSAPIPQEVKSKDVTPSQNSLEMPTKEPIPIEAPKKEVAPKFGSLTGTVKLPTATRGKRVFRGSAYRSRLSSTNESCCGSESDGESKASFDVVVSAHPLSFKVETEPTTVQMKQKNAVFVPHVLPVTPGTTVEFINNDGFYHNVFSKTPGNTFNIGRRATGEVVSKTIAKQKIVGAGEVKIFCDIHAQMNAVILSLETPYFTKPSDNGTFELKNLPPGKYEIRLYHPDFTEVREELVIEPGRATRRDFQFSN